MDLLGSGEGERILVVILSLFFDRIIQGEVEVEDRKTQVVLLGVVIFQKTTPLCIRHMHAMSCIIIGRKNYM